MASRLIWQILRISVAISGIVTIGGCFRNATSQPVVEIRCSSPVNAPLQFELTSQGINDISSLVIWSESKAEPLWAFRIGPTPVSSQDLKTITYGEFPPVPDPALRRIRPVFPKTGKPRQIERGERFVVKVDYQYDSALGPSGAHKSFSFEMGADNSVKPTGTFEFVTEPKKVQDLVGDLYGP